MPSGSLRRFYSVCVSSVFKPANDVNTAADRRSIDEEVQQLIKELDRISDTTFNPKILNGSFIQNLHVGAEARETVAIRFRMPFKCPRIDRGQDDRLVSTNAFSKAIGSVIINGITMRTTTSVDDTLSTSFAEGSAIAKAAAINDASKHSGVTATVNGIVDGNQNITSGTLDENSFIEINGTIITGFKVETDDANGELASQIIHPKYRGCGDRGLELPAVLTAIDGRNIGESVGRECECHHWSIDGSHNLDG